MLKIIHSNRLQRLADRLIGQLRERPPGPFEAECILVQNPGMKRWLQQAVARQLGIAAELGFPLPSRFLWDLYQQQFDDPASLSSWDTATLRWRLMRALEDIAGDPRFVAIKPYLEDDPEGIRRWQLAERLAGLFDQYQVYRPEMIQAWLNRETPERGHAAWQAGLMRRLNDEIEEPNRAQLLGQLVERLRAGGNGRLPPRVSLFALSSLSRQHLEVFAALAQRTEVIIYHLNPCQEFWGDIRSRRESLEQQGQAWSESELLASLGAQGREFIDLLYAVAPNAEDDHDFEIPQGDHLLATLQRQILTLEEPPKRKPDDSIRFVSCYSELRELQVLHDQLLQLLAEDDSLQPHDIVVMHPQIDRIAPMIEAVFGQQPSRRRIPWSLSDHHQLETDPLLRLLIDWLGLPQSRFTASEILGWLEQPALQRRYDLNEEDIEGIRFWVRELHIHWARDGRHRASLQLGGSDLYSWKRGLDRLLAAAVISDEVDSFDGLPLPELLPGQDDLRRLGRLRELLDDLWQWRKRLTGSACFEQWQARLNGMVGMLLAPDDEDELRLQPLRELLDETAGQIGQTGFDRPLSAAWMQRFLTDGLRQRQSHHRYLSGGVTFSDLIPMRMLPFRVVCLLGMNDDDFPRREIPKQFDLIASGKHRPGDRSRRDDDRYLFLQALLSAGDVFHVSWVGRDRRDDSKMEPSVVVRQLMDEIERVCGEAAPVREKPLQAFSARNFSEGSFARCWWPDPQAESPGRFARPLETMPHKQTDGTTVDDLKRFFRNPAQYFLQQRLNLRLGIDQDQIEDDETFELDALQRWKLKQRQIHALLQEKDPEPEPDLFIEAGELPPGPAGRKVFDETLAECRELAQSLKEDPGYSGPGYVEVDLQLEEWPVSGRIRSCSRHGLLNYSLGEAKGKSLMAFWIEHCLINAQQGPAEGRVYFGKGKSGEKPLVFPAMSEDEAKGILKTLQKAWQQGQAKPLPFYPDSAWIYVTERNNTGDEQQAWNRLILKWENELHPLGESRDEYILTAIKPDDLPDEELAVWASVLMQPLFDAIGQQKPRNKKGA
jgi:exodeoxyribonuclease V gamma subunit